MLTLGSPVVGLRLAWASGFCGSGLKSDARTSLSLGTLAQGLCEAPQSAL